MSYGKYGMKINVGNYSVPWSTNDTAYNIGSLLGTLWGENYNRRGIEKGEQEALDALRGAQSVGVGNVPDKLYDLGVQSGAIGATGNTPNASAATSSGTSNAPIGATGDQALADKVSAQDKIATEKWGLYKTKYNSGTPNPDEDAKVVGNTSNTIANNLAGFDFSTLPVTNAKMLAQPIEAQLRKAGRTDYQIQEIMKRINPQLESKVQGNVNQATQMLYDQYKSLEQQGRYDESSIIMGKILELNPTVGKALANQYNRNQQDFKTQYDFDKQVEYYKKNDPTLSDREARNMVLYKNFRSPKEQEQWALAHGYGYGIKGTGRGIGVTGGGGDGRKGGAGGPNPKPSSTNGKPGYWAYGGDGYKLAAKEYDDLSKIPPDELTAEQKARLERYGKYLESARQAVPDVDAAMQAERESIRARLNSGEPTMSILASYPAGPLREMAHNILLGYSGTSAGDYELIMPSNHDSRLDSYSPGILNYNGSYGGEDFELPSNTAEPPMDYAAPNINRDVDVDGARILSRDALGNPTLTYKPNDDPVTLDYRKVFGASLFK